MNQRINTYVKGASVTHHLPIAEALINRHGSDDDSSRFIPFVGVSNVYFKYCFYILRVTILFIVLDGKNWMC